MTPERRQRLRDWLAYVAQTAIDWLDELDRDDEDREDDEREPVHTREEGWL